MYEYLYDLGSMLQTPDSMIIFNDGFRPWPHVYKPGQRSKKFYSRMDANLTQDLAQLRTYESREDKDNYGSIFLQVLMLFGQGIIASLEFTMGNYLRQTDGLLQNANRNTWEFEATKKMLCHNNHAERPFAVLRGIWKTYPSLSLQNLGWLAHSLANGTHRPAHTYGTKKDSNGDHCFKAGIALTAHPTLKRAVNIVCSVKRKTIGAVTQLVRAAQASDKEEQGATRKRKAREKYLKSLRLKASKALKADKAEHTAAHHLVLSIENLENELTARITNKQSTITFLKDQFDARVVGELQRTYHTIGPEYRKRGGGLRKCPADKRQELTYLTELVKLMITEDQDTLGFNSIDVHGSSFQYIRFLPTITTEFANPKVKILKDEFEAEIAELSAPVDDPVYCELAGKFMGAILYDFETRATWKLYRVSAIQFIRSYASHRPSCWEATCEPVYRDGETGQFLVPADQRVDRSKILKTTALQGYALAEYRDGIEKDPTFLPWVDQYVHHFRTVIMPHYKSLFASEVRHICYFEFYPI